MAIYSARDAWYKGKFCPAIIDKWYDYLKNADISKVPQNILMACDTVGLDFADTMGMLKYFTSRTGRDFPGRELVEIKYETNLGTAVIKSWDIVYGILLNYKMEKDYWQ